MEQLKGYEKAQAYTEPKRLPIGGYIIKILNIEELKYDRGNVLKFDFDIVEGDYKDFYRNNYNLQTQEDKKWKGTYRLNIPKDDGSEKDEWTMRNFKTAIQAIEDSNENYHWDWNEKSLVGKVVGALFRNKEYDYNGNSGFYTECCAFKSVDLIKSGKFKIPADKLLNNKNDNTFSEEFMPKPVNDDDIPF